MSMATTFHKFSRLPPELRLKIWDHSLDNDKAGRHVLLKMTRGQGGLFERNSYQPGHHVEAILPTKQLASPLLGVNHEARELFLKHFPVGLDIVKTEVTDQNTTYRILLIKTPDIGFGLCKGLYMDSNSFKEKERRAGVVYLNVETDIFVLGVEASMGCSLNFGMYRKLLECHSHPFPRHVFNHIRHVLNLGHYRPYDDSQIGILLNIDTASFPSLQTYRYLLPKLGCRCHETYKDKLEWEDLRCSVVERTNQEFRRDLAQSKLCLETRYYKG